VIRMNLEAMFRSMMGRTISMSNNILELQVGQMVKGVLIKMLSENEAMFRIQGTTLHAQLETPVRPGQETWFQVHSASQSNRIVLKVVGAQGNNSGDSLLTTLGIKPNVTNQLIVDTLMSHRMPVTPTTVSAIQHAVRQLPPSIEETVGIRTGVIAIQKQLPATPFILESIASALANPKVETASNLWNVFRTAVMEWVGQEAENRTPSLNQTETRLPEKASIQTPAAQGSTSSAGSQSTISVVSNPNVSTEVNPGEVTPVGRTTAQTDLSKTSILTIRSLGEVLPQGHQTEDVRSNGLPAKDQLSQRSVTPQLLVEAFKQLDETVQRILVPTEAANEQSSPLIASKGEAIRQWLQTVGVAQSTLPDQPASRGSTESLKNMIVQLLQQPDVPLLVKDSAGQLLQHITGQQILSLPDQTHSHVQMFVQLPFHTGQGDSATIYIQSRKRKGEGIDPDQCRLFFHLQMKHLGETWVDANIHLKSIDIHIMSDHHEMETRVKEHILTLNSGLKEQGYEIRSFQTSPLPESNSKIPNTTEKMRAHRSDYKGVDFRI
jgi:hypothetical protein